MNQTTSSSSRNNRPVQVASPPSSRVLSFEVSLVWLMICSIKLCSLAGAAADGAAAAGDDAGELTVTTQKLCAAAHGSKFGFGQFACFRGVMALSYDLLHQTGE